MERLKISFMNIMGSICNILHSKAYTNMKILSIAHFSADASKRPLLGDVLIIVATFCFAFSNVGEVRNAIPQLLLSPIYLLISHGL
jgi:hypothetical protein